MRTIQMTLDENTVESVDIIVKKLKMTRSAFTRQALREAIERYEKRILEEQHIDGYKNQPTNDDEFSVWEIEQDWGDK